MNTIQFYLDPKFVERVSVCSQTPATTKSPWTTRRTTQSSWRKNRGKRQIDVRKTRLTAPLETSDLKALYATLDPSLAQKLIAESFLTTTVAGTPPKIQLMDSKMISESLKNAFPTTTAAYVVDSKSLDPLNKEALLEQWTTTQPPPAPRLALLGSKILSDPLRDTLPSTTIANSESYLKTKIINQTASTSNLTFESQQKSFSDPNSTQNTESNSIYASPPDGSPLQLDDMSEDYMNNITSDQIAALLETPEVQTLIANPEIIKMASNLTNLSPDAVLGMISDPTRLKSYLDSKSGAGSPSPDAKKFFGNLLNSSLSYYWLLKWHLFFVIRTQHFLETF